MDARPATSCHGWFKADCPMADLETGFTLEHSCIARERHPCTYFSLIGYQGAKSGGYGGIQEDKNGKGILVFSIWDSPTDETKSISTDHHPDSIIRRFGGEGVGMQCLLYKDWNLDEVITQKIIGKLVEKIDDTNNNDTNSEEKPSGATKQKWHISSQIITGSETYQMATYEWIGPGHPLYAPKFNCFVEDWDRSKGANGHLRCRSANFIDAKILDSNGVAHVATFDSFHKVNSGLDEFASNKVIQKCEIFMATGGSKAPPHVFIDGPLSVWNGQEDLASITNDAGEWPHGEQGGLLQNMLDGNLDTFWHSSGTTVNEAKTIKIEFKAPIKFAMLSIRKRNGYFNYRYNNVCLVLNGDVENQMQTNTPAGFDNDQSPFITWYKPTLDVSTVELVFRDNQVAQIADLKIFFQSE